MVFDLEIASQKIRKVEGTLCQGHSFLFHAGRLPPPQGWRPPFVESFVDGCVVAVQVENFVLPTPAVGMEGQASKISKFEP